MSDRPRQPVLAGLYHPPGGIIRHDAVVWGYARGVDRHNIELHPRTEVTAIRTANGRVEGVVTTKGEIATHTVVNATAGWCSTIGHMAGINLPMLIKLASARQTESLSQAALSGQEAGRKYINAASALLQTGT